MKQIAKQYACSKRAVYEGPGMLTDLSLSVIGSCRSRVMPSTYLRQACVRNQSTSVAYIYKARLFDNNDVSRNGSVSAFSNDSFNIPLKKLPRDFRSRRGPGYEVVVFEKLIT